MKVSIIGAGSWGTALAVIIAEKVKELKIWCYENEVKEEINTQHRNSIYLPDIKIPNNVVASNDFGEVLDKPDIVFMVTPSHVTREIVEKIKHYISSHTIIVSCTKGIETETTKTMSEVYSDVMGSEIMERYCVLSGPTFAREVAQKLPTAAVVASSNEKSATKIQEFLSSSTFRIYTHSDVKGVELAGALKNVIAIAAGISDGMNLGLNARASIITRGMAEITRLGKKLGANPLTFLGLAGMGDLILTSTGDLSRNRRVGIELGRGRKLKEIVENMRMVAEGVKTCSAVVKLAERYNVDMPVSKAVYEILYNDLSPETALKELMSRSLKKEMEDII